MWPIDRSSATQGLPSRGRPAEASVLASTRAHALFQHVGDALLPLRFPDPTACPELLGLGRV